MSTPKLPQLTDEEWEQKFREFTDSELAREFNTSVTAVWKKRKKLELPPKQASTRTWSASGFIPTTWKVPLSEYDHPILVLLRDTWRLEHDERLVGDARELADWLNFMEDISTADGRRLGRGVVVFDPSLPIGSHRFFVEPWRKGDMEYARPLDRS